MLFKSGARLFRFRILQLEHVPAIGPFIVACNHISYFDPPLVGAAIPREINFMAKKELFKNKLFGKLLGRVNAHPINRGGFDKAALNTAIRILKTGQAILIFPEGTRAKYGDFLPPRPGIGLIAIKTIVPVIPAYINGTNQLRACLLGRERMGVIFGKPFSQEEIAGYQDNKGDYQKLAGEIMERIRSLKEKFSNWDKRS
ncbi:MAG: lysophospholipid acyltransferase family protein [candidate division Zixibacteria bacterium]|nr:lysophospholipid acyltransferase family protein [candidate division Zixibacteria bacterium]